MCFIYISLLRIQPFSHTLLTLFLTFFLHFQITPHRRIGRWRQRSGTLSRGIRTDDAWTWAIDLLRATICVREDGYAFDRRGKEAVALQSVVEQTLSSSCVYGRWYSDTVEQIPHPSGYHQAQEKGITKAGCKWNSGPKDQEYWLAYIIKGRAAFCKINNVRFDFDSKML